MNANNGTMPMYANQIYTSYTADYTARVEFAINKQGQLFTRTQYRDARFGYKWQPWRPVPAAALPSHVSPSPRKCRLPLTAEASV